MDKNKIHIIFDLDGTIFDTEFEVSRITANLVKEKMDYDISPERVFCEFAGLGPVEKFIKIAESEGLEATDEEFEEMGRLHEERKQALYDQDTIPVVLGVRETLERFYNNPLIEMTIGSTNPTERQKKGLKKEGLIHYFSGFFGPDLTNGVKKPEPDVFLLAMKTIGSEAENTFVVEDTDAGVIAGVRSGAHTVVYLDPRFGNDELAVEKTTKMLGHGVNSIMRRFDHLIAIVEAKLDTMKNTSEATPTARKRSAGQSNKP